MKSFSYLFLSERFNSLLENLIQECSNKVVVPIFSYYYILYKKCLYKLKKKLILDPKRSYKKFGSKSIVFS